MPLFASAERRLAENVSQLSFSNPFLPERITFEKEALGDEFLPDESVWNYRPDMDVRRPNVCRLGEKVETLVHASNQKLADGVRPGDRELTLYADLVQYCLFYRYVDRMMSKTGDPIPRRDQAKLYRDFADDWTGFFTHAPKLAPGTASHFFACIFQVGRAFRHVYTHLLGASLPMARLRAAVWQSIFTHDMRRYQRGIHQTMGDISTLILGPTGTGKELVARAIALSRYVPFDDQRKQFADDSDAAFKGINLSALSANLIESELFGHRRGSFTGADQDRQGWLEACGPGDSVFLDEIGELSEDLQVKLLRVLQTRTFQRVGEMQDRTFRGKILAATHRDLGAAIASQHFRADLYYRLCADRVSTPTLIEQIRDNPAEFHCLVSHLAHRLVGDESPALASDVMAWIEQHLGADYDWPGNIRELDQCIRAILVRNTYTPLPRIARSPAEEFWNGVATGQWTADELVSRYCTWIYGQTGNYEECARRLGLDRRTVKAKVREDWLRSWK